MKPRPEPGDKVVTYNDTSGTIVLEKPSGERFGGCFARVEEGKPLPPQSEYLIHAKDGKICDVTQLRGPVKASSKAYRTGYDRAFGKSSDLN
jgi:hypothetical protein